MLLVGLRKRLKKRLRVKILVKMSFRDMKVLAILRLISEMKMRLRFRAASKPLQGKI